MKAIMSEKLRKLFSHPEKARALQKALVTPHCGDPQPRATKQGHTLLLFIACLRKVIEAMSPQRAVQARRESLMQASLECRAESMRINKEFSPIEGDIRENDSTC